MNKDSHQPPQPAPASEPRKPQMLEATLESITPKHPIKSKTVWGWAIIAVLMLADYFGFDLQEHVGKAVQLLELLGGSLVVLGLRTAKQPLGLPRSGGGMASGGAVALLVVMGMALACLGLVSCSGTVPTLTPDGCVLLARTFEDGRKAAVGTCPDGRRFVQWQQPDASGQTVTVRATYHANGTYRVTYRTSPESAWVEWDSDSGFAVHVPGEGPPVETAK